ncbi:hypothetical protein C0993_005812 [Termitomyces sp. T159_Od127]|nr:hypothetical protein C0993_005812 [Termitomyces sp. T159_Od127]
MPRTGSSLSDDETLCYSEMEIASVTTSECTDDTDLAMFKQHVETFEKECCEVSDYDDWAPDEKIPAPRKLKGTRLVDADIDLWRMRKTERHAGSTTTPKKRARARSFREKRVALLSQATQSSDSECHADDESDDVPSTNGIALNSKKHGQKYENLRRESHLVKSGLASLVQRLAVSTFQATYREKVSIDPATNLPQISETRILGFAKHLSEEIGYRTVGTAEHALADTWMVQQAEAVKRNCEEVVAATGRKLECEVWRQEGSGSHRFDMMSKRLYKTYVDLTNIIVRISDGTAEGKEHAVLVNAHLDSTLPSPGAADDALSVGVMLDCIRVLVNTPDWSPKHAIIMLFNNAEESLQDASHLFSTQHPVASTVRAVINLEAAGTNGRELLFQATSEEMIQAYSHVPRPYGTVFANDVFSSGIILSE